jgi:hypothetical protein
MSRKTSLSFSAIAIALLMGCASGQLNHNVLDLASSSDQLMRAQVLDNVLRTHIAHYAVPAQVGIPSGSATTTNSITPTATVPINPSETSTLANTAAAPLFNALTHTHLMTGASAGISAADQWSQSWSLTPDQDPEQLLRLRALYRFGANLIDRDGLICEYPLVQKAGGSGGQTSVTIVIDSKKANIQGDKESKKISYSRPNSCDDPYFAGNPDPAYLTPPVCVICDLQVDKGATSLDGKTITHHLYVNRRLSRDWAAFSDALGGYGSVQALANVGSTFLYLASDEKGDTSTSDRYFNDFVMFALEAAIKPAAGSSSGSSSSVVQEKAAPALQLQ